MKSFRNLKIIKYEKLSSEEKKEIIISKVLDIAREIFATKGFKAFSINEVVKISGLKVEEIKEFFPDDQNIYWKVFTEEARIFYDQLFVEIQNQQGWLSTLKTLFYFSASYMYQKPLARKIIFPYGIDIPFTQSIYKEYVRKAKTYELPVKQYIENIIDKELFPGHSSVFVEIIFDFLKGLISKLDEGYDISVLQKEIDYFLNLIM